MARNDAESAAPAESLDERVDQLLEDLQKAVDGQGARPEPVRDDATEDEAEDGAGARSGADEADSATAERAEAGEHAESGEPRQRAEPDTRPARSEALQSLDAELAGEVDHLLEDEFEEASTILSEFESRNEYAAVEDLPGAEETAGESVRTEESAGERAPTRTDAMPLSEAMRITTGAARAAAGHSGPAWRATEPSVLKLLDAAAAPINRRPKYVRDLIGWCAAVTLFYALCAWGYILLIRQPSVPEPTQAPVQLRGDAGEAGAGVEPQS